MINFVLMNNGKKRFSFGHEIFNDNQGSVPGKTIQK